MHHLLTFFLLLFSFPRKYIPFVRCPVPHPTELLLFLSVGVGGGGGGARGGGGGGGGTGQQDKTVKSVELYIRLNPKVWTIYLVWLIIGL